MKIYKYLSLNTCEQRQRFLRILRTGEIWFSKFHTLGDPMEGIYHTYASEHTKQLFASEKNKYLIGCFGKSESNHMLWAYYADGYSGACVEIDALNNSDNSNEFDVAEIEYVTKEKFKKALHLSSENTKEVLTRKLLSWKNENELRLLTRKETQPEEKGAIIEVGKVASVTFGVNIPNDALSFLGNTAKQLIDSNDQFKWKIMEPMEPINPYDNLQQALDTLNEYKLWRADFSG